MSDSARPLDGCTVLDFTAAWAGPMATRSLAYLGAEVIKIESAVSLDSWRGAVNGGAPTRYPEGEPGAEPFNRDAYFNTQNHDKLSIALDLKAPEGRAVVHRLAETADVVVANFSPGVLDRLDVGFEALSRINPRIIVVEMPAFGVGGPMTRHVGMGKTMEAASGMASLMGYGDDVPVLTGPAYLDPVGGLHGAAAVLTALYERNRTGHGSRIEVAQTEATMNWIGEYLLAVHAGLGLPEPRGNRIATAAPHGAYRCAGEDAWLVLAVWSDAQWSALCEAIGRPDLVDDPRYATTADRIDHQDEIDEVVAQWSGTVDKHAGARLLQSHGVTAAPVFSGADVHDSQGLREAGFVTELENETAGRHEYPGLAYSLSRTPGRMQRHAPRYGEHNDEVLRGRLGMTADEVADLRSKRVIVDAPDRSMSR